ncbi:MAG: hypothetical protein J6J97_08880, partial [Akkermansia sp.]|nr:hypothetical protein [Akkermansia sp.]
MEILLPRAIYYTSKAPKAIKIDLMAYFNHACPKDFVRNRNINNIFEEASPLLDKLEYAEVRGTRWEVRSIKLGRLRLQVFSIDNKWRAARLAELSLRTSH